jgi:hypothetical protein
MSSSLSRLYARYAVALLFLTLIAGVYLRAHVVWPGLRGSLSTPYLVHAHSHAGFFGWMVLAAAAALVLRAPPQAPAAAHLHRFLAHAIGIGSFAAFVGFALRGYDTATIALSAAHVVLWIALVAVLWRQLGRAPNREAAAFFRTGLAFLAGSGVATIVPVMLMVRGVSDPWLQQLGVKLFLTPFVTGFLMLTALGMLYERLPRARNGIMTLALIAAGTLPSTFLYVPGAPAPLVTLVGRLGMGMVAAGLLLFSSDALQHAWRGRDSTAVRAAPLATLAAIAAAVAGVIMLLAAAGVGVAFMHNRSIVIAVLHLMLLGIVTPAFVLALTAVERAGVRTAAYAVGLVLLLVPLAATGWPWAARALMLRGIGMDALLSLAAVGGIITAAALVTLLTAPHRALAAAADASQAAAGAAEAAPPELR